MSDPASDHPAGPEESAPGAAPQVGGSPSGNPASAPGRPVPPSSPPVADDGAAEWAASDGDEGSASPDRRRRRRGSRGGRSRVRAGDGAGAGESTGPPAAADLSDAARPAPAPAGAQAAPSRVLLPPVGAEAAGNLGLGGQVSPAGPPGTAGQDDAGRDDAGRASGPGDVASAGDPAAGRDGAMAGGAVGGSDLPSAGGMGPVPASSPAGSRPAAAAAPAEPPGPEGASLLPPVAAAESDAGLASLALSKPKIGDSRPAPPPRRPARLRPGAAGAAEGAAEAADRLGPGPAGAAGPASGPAPESDNGGRKRRRRGGRARGGAGGADNRPIEAMVDGPFDVDDDLLESRRGRERKGRPVGRYLMIVSVRPRATQIAVLEGRALIEHYVSHPSDDVAQIDGNIYLGRVQNVLPGMEAAFVDIGTPKNAVLYRGDVRYDKEEVEGDVAGGGTEATKPTRGRTNGPSRDARIEQLLKAGQTIVCQVTKNPIGTKGARLTQEVSLPGRFVVLIPNSDTYGISKRLADDERKRLRRILDDIRPAGHGLIVRTAAEGATADELRRDVTRLMHQWERIDSLAKRSRAPALLYREPDMAVRVIREEFNKDYRGVVIDDQALYEEVRDYVASISPELADRVDFAGDSDNPLPVFERFHVHEQVHRALDRKVWLPSGGSLIIERTEALTVIDVNTGKNVGTSNLEETVYRNNLEAAHEIARQLRLRDIGGIIVIDFIDMEISGNRADVIRTFREALARDKTRTQVFDISELGLVEMTRKRISEGLVESFSETCPMCGGRGIVLDESLL